MRHLPPLALMLAAASLTVLGSHSPAFAAETRTDLTTTDMTTALAQVAAHSAAAAEQGWKGINNFTLGKASGTNEVRVDTEAGIVVERLTSPTLAGVTYASAGKGMYEGLFDSRSKAVVKMTGRTGTGYLFTSKKSLTVASFLDGTFAPTRTPPPAKADTNAHEAGTKISNPDGTTDYEIFLSEHSMTLTFHVSTAGALTGIDSISTDVNSSITYTYGKQSVLLPPASQSISRTELRLGSEYLNMSRAAEHARYVADTGATATRRAAKGRTVKVTRLRTQLRATAKKHNTNIKMNIVKIRDVKGGVRVYVKNPWTKAARAYTVKVSGTKVVVK